MSKDNVTQPISICRDAGELLILIYNQYVKGIGLLDLNKIGEITAWDRKRIALAAIYLADRQLIKGNIPDIGYHSSHYNFIITGLFPEGIRHVEEGPLFKKNFGFEVGLPGVFKFSWGSTQ